MKIAMLAPFEEAVPPKKYGGTELVVSNLTEKLVEMGHDVTLLATGDSTTSAKLEAIFPVALRSNPTISDMRPRDTLKLIGISRDLSFLKVNQFDIIHSHEWRTIAFEHLIDCPVITTLHNPLDKPHQKSMYEFFPKSNYVSISHNQRKVMPNLNFVANIYNGIDTKKFSFHSEPKDYFAFLGRMSPEKGPVQAIRIAKKAGIKLVMAAKVDVADQKYFDENVKPLIDGEQIKFIGEVDHAGKIELLGNAKALLAPIQWEEPFGLYFVEAMACGTPVITLNRGSAPEIIVDGKTGFICQSDDEAAEGTKDIQLINRQDCFDHVNSNFSAEKMAKNYEELYKKILSK